MSTEARRASIPPRPSRPPLPGDGGAEDGEWSETPGSPGRPPIQARGTDSDPGPAASRGGVSAPSPVTPPPPPVTPPPPPASARFPDTPPAPGRDAGQDSAGTSVPTPAPSQPPTGTPAPGLVPPRPGVQPPVPPRRTGAPAETASERPTGTPAPGLVPPRPGVQPPVPPRRTGAPAETASETTFRMRPIPADPAPAASTGRTGSTAVPPMPRTAPGAPARPDVPPRPTHEAPAERPDATPRAPDPALSWSAPMPPLADTRVGGRPVVSFGQPEAYEDKARPRSLGGRIRSRTAAAAACVVLGMGLIGGAVTGSWLIGDSAAAGTGDSFAVAGSLWHSVPVDQLFPPTVAGKGAGPGGADRTWTRIAVAPDSRCKGAFDPLLQKALAPVGCERLLRATYTDATQSYVTTVGLLFTGADAPAMDALNTRFTKEGLDSRTDLMPRPYAAKNTVAADFGTEQRASWTVSVLTDAPVVVYAVSGWADGRTVDDPQPAEQAMESGATTDPAQAGLGNEARGLADRIERTFRKTVNSPTEQPS